MSGGSELAAALGGALATVLLQVSWNWFRRPVLKMTFAPNEPGCEVTTPTTNPKVDQKYLRIRIENLGRTFAKNVSLTVTRFRCDGASGPREFREEVLPLKTAIDGEYKFNLAAGAHRFVDLICATVADGIAYQGFVIDNQPIRLGAFTQQRGPYTAMVFASAENAESVFSEAHWTWGGSLETFIIRWPP